MGQEITKQPNNNKQQVTNAAKLDQAAIANANAKSAAISRVSQSHRVVSQSGGFSLKYFQNVVKDKEAYITKKNCTIYKFIHDDGKEYVIKVLPKSQKNQGECNEFRVTRDIVDPSIAVTVLEYYHDEHSIYLVSRFVNGGDLAQQLGKS